MGTMGMARGGWIVAAGSDDPGAARLSLLGDEALMTRYRHGEADAFEVLYRRHGPALYRFIRRLMGGTADCDEVFQEVWLALIRGLIG